MRYPGAQAENHQPDAPARKRRGDPLPHDRFRRSAHRPAVVPRRPGPQYRLRTVHGLVHCGLCLSSCPTYVETGNETTVARSHLLWRPSPTGRAELTPECQHLDLCLECRPANRPVRRRATARSSARTRRTLAKLGTRRRSSLPAARISFKLTPYAGACAALAPLRCFRNSACAASFDSLGRLCCRVRCGGCRRSCRPRLEPHTRLPESCPPRGRAGPASAFSSAAPRRVLPQRQRRRSTSWPHGCDVYIPRSQGCAAPSLPLRPRRTAREFAAANSSLRRRPRRRAVRPRRRHHERRGCLSGAQGVRPSAEDTPSAASAAMIARRSRRPRILVELGR